MRLGPSSHLFRVILVVAFALTALPVRTAGASGTRRYARPGGSTTSVTCASWADACELYHVLDSVAVAGDQIWAQQGIYTPDPSSRSNSLVLHDGVAVYGGFVGGETQLSQRNQSVNTTVLSGDLGMPGDSSDNSYHVVVSNGAGPQTVLDGFTIRDGYATDFAGGMWNHTGTPTLSNLIFTGNHAYFGGGMANDGGGPTLKNVTFTGNQAQYGGGMNNYNGTQPHLTNVTFSYNYAAQGGGLIAGEASVPVLSNVTFRGNIASGQGGGLYAQNGSDLHLTNVRFTANSATDGGGLFSDNANPVLTSVTFNGNFAANGGGGAYNLNSNPVLNKVTFIGNFAVYGGGLYDESSDPTLTNITFRGNMVGYGGQGGGLYNKASSPTLKNVSFVGNLTGINGSGGGMANNDLANPQLTNVAFSGNQASLSGGGIYNVNATFTLTNGTLTGNTAGYKGGAVFNLIGSPTLRYVTISKNTAATTGGGILNYDSTSLPTVQHSILWGNSGGEVVNQSSSQINISDAVVKGNCPVDPSFHCTHIITKNPLLGPLASNGGFTKTMALGLGSPAIDAVSCLPGIKTDQRGVHRPQGPKCDMGAYEYVP